MNKKPQRMVGEVGMSSRPTKRTVEFIESYWTGGEYGSGFMWNDNHGELIRCKDCKFRKKDECSYVCIKTGDLRTANWFCADGERKDDDA